jgi:putative ABC transport system permease protein
MRTLLQDLRFGWRTLWRRPGFTAVAVLTLALGIGANTAIFSVVNAVLLRPLPYEGSEWLVVLTEESRQNPSMFISYPNFLDWKERSRSFEALAVHRQQAFILTGGEEPERLDGRQVSADFFNVFGVRPELGRAFLGEEDRPGGRPVAVLSHGLWERRFGGGPGVVGGTITLDGRPFTVVGVLPEGFRAAGEADVFVPFGQWSGQPGWMNRDVRPGGRAVGRLKTGTSIESARAEMRAITAGLEAQHPRTNTGVGVRLVPLYESVVGDTRPALLMLLGAVALLLLIACANIANLLLARAASRRQEFAVRAALGASRWRLARQLLTESVVLALLGGGLGLLLALWGVDLLSASGAGNLPRATEIGVDARVVAFTALVTLLTGVAFGLVPALQNSAAVPGSALKAAGRGASASGGRRLSGALIIAETALALVLLVGAGLLVKSFARLQEVDPGFDHENVLTMRVPLPRARYAKDEQVAEFYRALLERVRSLPGVESAAVANELPFTGRGWPVEVEAADRPVPPAGQSPVADWGIVSPEYFRTMGIPLIRGRALAESDTAAARRVVVVDEEVARHFWPGGEAVGQRLRVVGPDPFEVVGVARRVRNYGLDADSRMRVYVPAAQTPMHMMNLAVRASGPDAEGLAKAVAGEVRALDSGQPVYGVRTMERIVSESLAPRRFNMALVALFAAGALLLASIGIYGVIAYTVARRTREIGIRVALGARRGDVLRLVLGQGMRPALAGVGLGLAASLALTRLMSSLLYGVSATDPVTFAAVSGLLVVVALLACYFPARRATKVDPAVALRYE